VTTLIACATPLEADAIIRYIGWSAGQPEPVGAGSRLPLAEPENLALLITGIGKASAALTLTAAIHRFGAPDRVLNTGIAGAYPDTGAEAGAVVVATSETYGDEGVQTPSGYRTMADIGFPLFRSGGDDILPLPDGAAIAAHIADRTGRPILSGPYITVSTCTGTPELAKHRGDRFHPMCETMEGAALAHVCRTFGVPFVEIRGVSNLVGHYDKRRWDIPRALEQAAEAVRAYLET